VPYSSKAVRGPTLESPRWRFGNGRTPPWQNRDKTLKLLELPLSEKQIPQVVEIIESGGKPKEALETVELRPRQRPRVRALYLYSKPIGLSTSAPKIPRSFASQGANEQALIKVGPLLNASVTVEDNPLLFDCAKTVSGEHLFQLGSLHFKRKEIPQIVVIAMTSRKPMALLETVRLPWAQGVGRSNRPAPTIRINGLGWFDGG
jgi:hypothetical protein